MSDSLTDVQLDTHLASRDSPSLVAAGVRRIAAPASAQAASSRTVLLVDDDLHVLQAMALLLQAEGYRILTATCGSDGLELLSRNDVQMVVSDQRMPGMIGTDFLRQVQARYPETIRILCSGEHVTEEISAAFHQGTIQCFLGKPCAGNEVRQRIKDAFAAHTAKVR